MSRKVLIIEDRREQIVFIANNILRPEGWEVITARDGAPNFAMRIFDVEADGHTPLHTHDYEHEVFVLKGSGHLETAEGPKPFKQGDALFIPANALHQFRNTGGETLRFICLIPIEQNCAR